MVNKVGKWLCVGGCLHGQWYEQAPRLIVDPYNNPLREQVYEPRLLKNPISNKDETFFIFKGLIKERIEFAIKEALESQPE
ncbi:hypothetical protein [Acinetobacter baumannii]|uniref:hypothetical protein n=1 Tax=Acinetobacter baumannii TaxID=470 RepID=UPI0007A3B079|nr:hypothetical protein [Acinetobacter baumannii]EHU2142725.1 hypothetical protein [Acinetobacter baumannii]EHU2653778.1 hypothetical protein [Acinetobacter baumannii]EHU2721927.1 hypothetical protein [Acinetobacter baumannii]EHU2840309.1 hypothetical protein [Acinetobacter baumannii]EHU3379604.1 hypothetical protein [Acinetobacter baumannii]